jgi:hypothetical protein
MAGAMATRQTSGPGIGFPRKTTVLKQLEPKAPTFRMFGTPAIDASSVLVTRGSCDIGRPVPPLECS